MKTLKKPLMYVALALLPILFSKCTLTEDLNKLQSAVDSVQLNVSTPEFITLAHIVFIDAKTKEYILNDVSVKVSGKNASYIFNNIGEALPSYTSIFGMLDLVVDPHKVDTTEMKLHPIEFDITTSIPGYVNVSQTIRLRDANGSNIEVPLIKLSDAPQGVSVAQNSTFATSSTSGMVLQKATESINDGKQTIEIPAGVVLKDATGKPLNGTVSAQIIYFDPKSEEAVAAIPGGMNVGAKMPDGSNGQINFSTAGMFGVSLTVNGSAVKTFENGGVNIKTKIDPTLINPKTGNPVIEGDVIEMWSKEEGTGNWVFEKVDTVKMVNGDLILEETVKHLSWWNWDWYRYYPPCYIPAIYNYEVDESLVGVKCRLKGYDARYGHLVVNQPIYSSYWHDWSLYNYSYSGAINYTIEVDDSQKDQYSCTPTAFKVTSFCNGAYYPFNIIKKPVVDVLTVKTDLSLSAKSNARLIIKPTSTIYLRQKGGQFTNNYLKKGVATLNIKIGMEYEIFALYGSSYASGRLKVDNAPNNKISVTYTPAIISGSTTGKSITLPPMVKPANKKITLKYNIQLPDNVFNKLN